MVQGVRPTSVHENCETGLKVRLHPTADPVAPSTPATTAAPPARSSAALRGCSDDFCAEPAAGCAGSATRRARPPGDQRGGFETLRSASGAVPSVAGAASDSVPSAAQSAGAAPAATSPTASAVPAAASSQTGPARAPGCPGASSVAAEPGAGPPALLYGPEPPTGTGSLPRLPEPSRQEVSAPAFAYSERAGAGASGVSMSRSSRVLSTCSMSTLSARICLDVSPGFGTRTRNPTASTAHAAASPTAGLQNG